MMRIEKLREIKRLLPKLDFHLGHEQQYAIVNHGIEASEKLTSIALEVDRLDRLVKTAREHDDTTQWPEVLESYVKWMRESLR